MWPLPQIFTGWVITIGMACALGALFTALGVNSPNRQSIDQIIGANEVFLLLLLLLLLLTSSSYPAAAPAVLPDAA